MRLALPVKLLLVCSFLLAEFGCQAIRRYETQWIYENHSPSSVSVNFHSETPVLSINDESLGKIPFVARCRCSDVTVTYQEGMRPLALTFANNVSRLLKEVQHEIGLRIIFNLEIYLVYGVSSFQGLDVQLNADSRSLRFVMMVPAADPTMNGLLLANAGYYPYGFVHELVEGSLGLRSLSDRPVPLDFTVRYLGLNFSIHNHTRWFREGLANYAGLFASRKMSEQVTPQSRTFDPILRYRYDFSKAHDEPFTNLAIIRERLFDWVNSPEKKNTGEYDEQCYHASLGVFLYLEHRFGEGSVKRIVQNLKGNGCLDGEQLIEVVNNTLRTDLRTLVRDFQFPEDGLKLTMIIPHHCPGLPPSEWQGILVDEVKPDSPAAAWGVQKGDIINSMQGQPVRNTLDYEIAKMDLVEKGRGTMRVVRKEEIHELKTWLR